MQLCKSTLFIFLLSLTASVYGQKQVYVKSSLISDNLIDAYILVHTQDNEIFSQVHIDNELDFSEYFVIETPNDESYSVTILQSIEPESPDYYHGAASISTAWNNKQDTIFSLTPSTSPTRPLSEYSDEQVPVRISVEGLGKLDDIYCSSVRENFAESVRRVNGKDVEIAFDAVMNVGRCIFLVNKKDEEYRQIIVFPSAEQEYDLAYNYRDLTKHASRKEMNFESAYPYFIIIDGNTKFGDKIRIYASPAKYEGVGKGIEVDLPVGVEFVNYEVGIRVRDVTSSEVNYYMAGKHYVVNDLSEITFPELLDVSELVKKEGLNYFMSFDKTKFDRWVLQLPIEGFLKTPVSMHPSSYRLSNWFIFGEAEGQEDKVFIPQLTDEIQLKIFGERGYLETEKENWTLIKDRPNHKEMTQSRKF